MVKIKFNIIASLYDYNPNLAAFMKVRAVVLLNVTYFCSLHSLYLGKVEIILTLFPF